MTYCIEAARVAWVAVQGFCAQVGPEFGGLAIAGAQRNVERPGGNRGGVAEYVQEQNSEFIRISA